jgi:RimJ/RimL family protein N-acetyltransferase
MTTAADPTPIRLTTPRLALGPLGHEDAAVIAELAGDRAVADTTISIPHPLDGPGARAWLQRLAASDALGESLHLAIRRRYEGDVVGVAALREIDRAHEQAELSFWVGRPYWGQGLAGEAVGALITHGFTTLALNRIYAYHMVRNPASARVLDRLGFREEGLLRQRVKKWGVYEDVVVRALLRRDWAGAQRP